jgi:DNA-binding CsgD family transcriptional regulator
MGVSRGATIATTLGFACYIEWELISLIGPVLPLSSYSSLEDSLIFQIMSTGIVIVLLAVAGRYADEAFAHKNVIFVGASLCSLLMIGGALLAGLVDGPPRYLGAFSWIACGVGRCGFILLWSVYFSLMQVKTTALSIASGILSGVILLVLLASAHNTAFFFVNCAALIVISASTALFLSLRIPREQLDEVRRFRRISPFVTSIAFTLGVAGFFEGFLLVTLFALGIRATILGMAGMIVGGIFALASVALSRGVPYDLPLYARRAFPIMIAGVLLLPFFDDIGRVVCCAVVTAALAYHLSMGWITTTASNNKFKLHPVTHSSFGRIPIVFGLFMGFSAAFMVYFLFDMPQLPFSFTIVVFVLFIAVCYSIGEKDLFDAPGRFFPSEDKQAAVLPQFSAQKKLSFRERCDRVVEEGGLSPRESEIFNLMVKGRNAGYISNKLFVSLATVKTHIYHIYAKLGVNSQQSLIDLIEQNQDDSGNPE